jgi:MerR family mercuric resistance operon transcriptional regulator
MVAELTIGKLANAVGVNVETIRYYQRVGLLDEPVKPLGGHRRYSVEDAKRLRFIRRAQALGFTLFEIAILLRLDEGCACSEARKLAARRLALIEKKISDLNAMQQSLGAILQQCGIAGEGKTCPIIDVLADK